MSRVLYVDLFSGASGDMLLGALLDLGLPIDQLRAGLANMDLPGYQIEVEPQVRHGISGTRAHVRDLARACPARYLADVRQMIGRSTLSPQVQSLSMAVFERLARVEARIHGLALEEVHFHELSAVDSIVDVVGFAVGLGLLGVEKVFASAVPLGSGTIETEHGLLPVPAPATLALLVEVGAPTCAHPARTEIVTPTAAALLAELATFAYPAMRVQAIGYGFGQKEFPWANAVRVWLGDVEAPAGKPCDQVVLLECNLDNATGETLGYALERLFAAGALDVWFTPVQMKKNRAGTLLSALVRPDQVESVAQVFLRETPTLGLRLSPPLERIVAERRLREVETPWGKVQVKEKWLAGERISISPEYEDCARIARAQGIPLQQVFEVVREAAS